MENSGLLACPFCPYGSTDFTALQRHVAKSHDDKQERQEQHRSGALVSDFELAQMLAFEEAGLPSELALDYTSQVATSKAVARDLPQEINRQVEPSVLDKEWTECFCGERVLFKELDAHSDMHAQEAVSVDEVGRPSDIDVSSGSYDDCSGNSDIGGSFSTSISQSLRNYGQPELSSTQSKGKRQSYSLKQLFLGSPTMSKKQSSSKQPKKQETSVKRLGRSELGPYAHEKQMPIWLRKMLEEGAEVQVVNKISKDGSVVRVESIANETQNLVPTLARLSSLDSSVQRAFYCSPQVCHVAKMSREGGFCGYRNIQMLVSYIRDAKSHGNEHFRGRLPSILHLQELIERAWDMGFNDIARIETGGIRLTRKYIGTPEAQAMFQSLKIPCEAMAFTTTNEVEATDALLDVMCDYLDDGTNTDQKVVITEKPPIYFQHRGHSMTIVGVESRRIRQSGREINSLNLVVFDPMFNPSQAMKKAATSNNFTTPDPAKLMRAYRKGESYLSKYKDFELLKLI